MKSSEIKENVVQKSHFIEIPEYFNVMYPVPELFTIQGVPDKMGSHFMFFETKSGPNSHFNEFPF